MNFFKSLKAKLLGSIKEDLNSALNSRRVDFNSKISGALDDLIAMKTGINISNIPQSISEEALLSSEDRKKAEANITSRAEEMGRVTPKQKDIYRFPKSDMRFVDNWIIFRTIPRPISDLGATYGGPDSAFNNSDYGVLKGNLTDPKGELGFDKEKHKGMTKEYTIAMYFPTGVRDNISVEYEAKEVGLSDIALDNLMQGQFGELFSAGNAALGETFQKAKQAAVAFSAFESGLVVDNPKFNTFQGVGFRDHSYSFTLYPYDEDDAKEITKIVHAFKMMMLPMSSSKNRRVQIMPAEWSIDFDGPILGHIEHPQNCFLKSCDVDYSGGKDMSFIEGYTQSAEAVPPEMDAEGNKTKDGKAAVAARVQHYPNGINLNLVFQEILNIDRLRYVQRVAASAMGAKQNVRTELDNFEKQVNAEVTSELGAAAEELTFVNRQAAQDALSAKGLDGEYEVVRIDKNTKWDKLVNVSAAATNVIPFYAMMNNLTGYNTGDLQKMVLRGGTRYGIRKKTKGI